MKRIKKYKQARSIDPETWTNLHAMGPKGLAVVFEVYGKQLLATAVSKLQLKSADAKDLVAELFKQLLEKHAELPSSVENVWGLLYTWMYNIHRNEKKKRIIRNPVPLDEGMAASKKMKVQPKAISNLSVKELLAWIEQIPSQEYRDILYLTLQGFKSGEIARIKQATETSITNKKYKAKKCLRELMAL